MDAQTFQCEHINIHVPFPAKIKRETISGLNDKMPINTLHGTEWAQLVHGTHWHMEHNYHIKHNWHVKHNYHIEHSWHMEQSEDLDCSLGVEGGHSFKQICYGAERFLNLGLVFTECSHAGEGSWR